ncbi:NlpC/P60 family protein [Streptantibioticus ferralitis]|uniref:Bifunctional lytic transglycosylase/C40 family peptidase n=1 Tax=Streptantibioticus ferralitis TaxID=236510 RepID=A0ABT5Z1X3_9ACTN|nr:bifunctional lytic transglycosylase/C40 family peptidase [Streptantibioticus ferralitis]MDF2257694.1 bifunctional lytic transglycosylase/C40 family peptidase [Streptantibioticus ferralitis]
MGTAVKAAVGTTAGLLFLAVIAVVGIAGIAGSTTSGITATGATLLPTRAALADIPARMLTLYQQAAATCPGLPWTVLAAIGKTETDHARNPHMISTAGAVGPMQFLPSTFATYATPVPPGGKTPPTPWDPVDAVYAAARLLCTNGARDGRNLRGAIFAYNHDTAYVNDVLHTAATYAVSDQPTNPDGAFHAPTPQAAIAIAYARAQLGRPYIWGGEGPTHDSVGFDCSGLTQAAYAAAGIRLQRVAQDQYNAGPHVPDRTPLRPGDLVFYGTPTHVHHVGLYVGAGRMIDAPRPHEVIREEPIRYAGDQYLGAVRVSARP